MKLYCRVTPPDRAAGSFLCQQLATMGITPEQEGRDIVVDCEGEYHSELGQILNLIELTGYRRMVSFRDFSTYLQGGGDETLL